MSEICEMCGGVWAGASLGRMFHCRPRKALKIKEKKRDAVKQIDKGGRRCECGQPATTFSAVTSRTDPVCQRCHDCEKKNQRNFGKGSDSIGVIYKVLMPKVKNLF